MHAVLILATALAATPARLSTTVKGSIEASLTRAAPDAGAALSAQVARLIRWRGDVVRNVHRGDRVTLLYEPGDAPELVALSYEGEQIELDAYLFTGPDGVGRYYDGDGVLIEPAIDNPPVPSYVQITEVVQHGRGKRRHNGVDLKAPEGSPVILPFDGVVSRVNWRRWVNGKCVEVAYPDGRLARFLHLSAVAGEVRRGATLAAGAPIGAVGSTGHSGAPHLHYEIRDRAGRVVDPLAVHGTHRAVVPAASVPAFQARVAELTRLLGLSSTRASTL